MTIVSANPDAYGRHARASALADFVELLAIHSVSITRARLVDFIVDNGWTLTPHENYVGVAEADDDDDSTYTEDTATRIFRLLNERAAGLGDWYPFSIDEAGRVTRRATAQSSDSYLLLLAITVAHAHNLPTTKPPTDLFPDVVCRTYTARGWSAFNFGATSGRGLSFDEALDELGAALRLNVDADAAPRSMSAQDAGADCVAHYPWFELRIGRWLTITQVTCASSNEWRTKLFDATPLPWQSRLNEGVSPRVVLAVPHHVEPSHLAFLLSEANSQVYILDRLSLTKYLPPPIDAEKQLLEALTEVEVESP